MSELPAQSSYTLSPDDKAAGVMVYTASGLSWGEVVVKNQIRVNTWLRTNSAPGIICLYDAKSISIIGGNTLKIQNFRELFIPTDQILSYHLRPPTKEPLDYDPTEPNRKLEAVSVLVGQFRFYGSIRMATSVSLATHLEITREIFSPLYEVEVTCPAMSALTPIRVTFALVRHKSAIFGVGS